MAIVVLAGSLMGCGHGHFVADDPGSHADVQWDSKGLTVKSSDDQGSKTDLKIGGSAHIDLRDEKGNGLKFDADAKDGVKMKAEGEGSSFENNVELTEREVGVPFFPGSTAVPIATMKARSSSDDAFISVRTAKASPEAVIEYYRSYVKDPSTNSASDDEEVKIELKGKLSDGREIGISANRKKSESLTTIGVVTHKRLP